MITSTLLTLWLAAGAAGAPAAAAADDEAAVMAEMTAMMDPDNKQSVDCKAVKRLWNRAQAIKPASKTFPIVSSAFRGYRGPVGCGGGPCPASDPSCKARTLDQRWREYEAAMAEFESCVKQACADREALRIATADIAVQLLKKMPFGDERMRKLFAQLSKLMNPTLALQNMIVIVAERPKEDWAKPGAKQEAAMLTEIFAKMLGAVEPGTMKPADLSHIVDFALNVVVSGDPRWPDTLKTISVEWKSVLRFVEQTRSKEGRRALLEAIALVKSSTERWRQISPEHKAQVDKLAAELEKAQPDQATVASLARELTKLESQLMLRQKADEILRWEVILTDYRKLLLWTFVKLPDGCDDKKRAPDCDDVYRFADRFRQILDGESPQGATLAGEQLPLPDGLARAKAALTGKAPQDPGCISFCGVFVGAVGLQIDRLPDGRYQAKTGWRIRRSGAEIDEVDEIAGAPFGGDGDDRLSPLEPARDLAEQVLDRATLLKQFRRRHDPPAPPPPPRQSPPSALGALLFAALPYSQDDRVSPGLRRAVTVADVGTLAVGGVGILAGIYAHNTNEAPWDDRLLRVGVVSIGLNVLVKIAASAYYASHYGGGQP